MTNGPWSGDPLDNELALWTRVPKQTTVNKTGLVQDARHNESDSPDERQTNETYHTKAFRLVDYAPPLLTHLVRYSCQDGAAQVRGATAL